jgi:hypothetical protein
MRKTILALVIVLIPITYFFVRSPVSLQKNHVEFIENNRFSGVIGNNVWEADGLNKPLGVSISARKEIYISDSGNGRIVKIGVDGTMLADFRYAGYEEFNYPVAALEDDEKIYVADLNKGFIRVLGVKGELQFSIPSEQESKKVGAFKPLAMVTDERHNLYVSDSNGRRIIEFSKEGKFQREFKGDKTDLWFVNSMTIDQVNNCLYALDTSKRQVIVLDLTSGAIVKSVPLPQMNSPRGMAIDEINKTMFITDMLSNSVFKVDLTTTSISRIALEKLDAPAGIIISANTLIIADRNNNRIVTRQIN